jgi:hypothetical protein
MREITPLTPNPMSNEVYVYPTNEMLVEIVSEYIELSSIEMEILKERFSSLCDADDLIESISDTFPTLDISNDAWDDMRRDFLEIL